MCDKVKLKDSSQLHIINNSDLTFAKNNFFNQTKTKGTYHLGTTVSIYSFGFGPKYYVCKETNL